jgi:hypothetical protein
MLQLASVWLAGAVGLTCLDMIHRAEIQAAISDASQPEHPGDSCRRFGNLPFRSKRQRVERLKPVIWSHSASRMIRSAITGGAALGSSRCRAIAAAARRA